MTGETAPLVSIVLPAYNAGATLADAIASLLQQTYENWELLLLDDGSRDDTLAVARAFNDPRIRIFSDGENRKLPRRLNQGIDMAQGRYIARMDADDLCFPERLARQVAYLERHPEIDLLGTAALLFNDGGEVLGLFPLHLTHAGICSRPWNGFYLPHPTWMGRAEWFRKFRYRIPEVERAEDQDLLLRSYPESRFACLPDILFAYRVREVVSLRGNRLARKNFLRAQLREFARRGEWIHALLAVSVFMLKSIKDIRRVVFGNKAAPATAGVDAAVRAEWLRLRTRLARQGRTSAAR